MNSSQQIQAPLTMPNATRVLPGVVRLGRMYQFMAAKQSHHKLAEVAEHGRAAGHNLVQLDMSEIGEVGSSVYLVTGKDLDFVHHILNYLERSDFHRGLLDVLGESLFTMTNDNPRYQELKRLIIPHLTPNAVSRYLPQMAQIANEVWMRHFTNPDGLVDFTHIADEIAALNVFRLLLPIEVSIEQMHEIVAYIYNGEKHVAAELLAPTRMPDFLKKLMALSFRYPGGNKAFLQDKNKLEEMLAAAIRAKFQQPENEDTDLLSAVVRSLNVAAMDLSDEELNNLVVEMVMVMIGMIAAGVATTTGAFRSLMKYIFSDSDRVDALTQEANTVLPAGAALTHEHLKQMPLLYQAIDMTLKLAPPVYFTPRGLVVVDGQQELEIEGYQVDPGSIILVPTYAINMTMEGDEHLSYGYGTRGCTGQFFANAELAATMAMFLQQAVKANINIVPDKPDANLENVEALLEAMAPKNNVYRLIPREA